MSKIIIMFKFLYLNVFLRLKKHTNNKLFHKYLWYKQILHGVKSKKYCVKYEKITEANTAKNKILS